MINKKVSEYRNYHNAHLCLPHKPELENIDVPSTLDGLVACVVGDVILLVLLEEVTGTHGVAALQQSLQIEEQKEILLSACGRQPFTGCEKKHTHPLPDQNGRALQRHSHHFMGVPGD